MTLKSGVLNSVLSTTDNADITYDSSDIIMFGGSHDSLSFSRCEGSSIIATGSDQYIGAGPVADSAIYDFGQGTTLFFDDIGGTRMGLGDLQVYNFRADTTGTVELNRAFGNTPTAVQTPDGRGGSYLSITDNGTTVASVVHFVNDPFPIKVV
jgi:hypothetical protein